MAAHVTLRISGMILLRFKSTTVGGTAGKVCQAGILINSPEDHRLRIKITKTPRPGISEIIEFIPAQLYQYAPLHIYVRPEVTIPETPPEPDTAQIVPNSHYDQVVDFEDIHPATQNLNLIPGQLAPLIIHQGYFSAPMLTQAQKEAVNTGTPPTQEDISPKAKSVLVDINLSSGQTGFIALEGINGFSRQFPIDVRDGSYLVDIQNAPANAYGHTESPENHFELFYDAIDLPRSEPHYMVSVPPPSGPHTAGLDSPPCLPTQIGSEGEMPFGPES